MKTELDNKEGIIVCLNNIGVIVDDLDLEEKVEDHLTDSVSYVSFIVELEQYFDIEIPDEYLGSQSIQSFRDIEAIIKLLQKCKSLYIIFKKGGRAYEKDFEKANEIF